MNDAREFALDHLRTMFEQRWSLDSVLGCHSGGGGPAYKDWPSHWYAMNGMRLFSHGDSPSVLVKKGQIGVDLCWSDGHTERGMFSIRELWREIAHPMPKQLSLFDEALP